MIDNNAINYWDLLGLQVKTKICFGGFIPTFETKWIEIGDNLPVEDEMGSSLILALILGKYGIFTVEVYAEGIGIQEEEYRLYRRYCICCDGYNQGDNCNEEEWRITGDIRIKWLKTTGYRYEYQGIPVTPLDPDDINWT